MSGIEVCETLCQQDSPVNQRSFKMKAIKVLIVEDEALIAMATADMLHNAGYHVTAMVGTGKEALKSVMKDPPDLILMDIRLDGDLDGIETAGLIQKQFNIPVIYISANLDEPTLDRIKNTWFAGCLNKPVHPEDLAGLMSQSLETDKDQTENHPDRYINLSGYFI